MTKHEDHSQRLPEFNVTVAWDRSRQRLQAGAILFAACAIAAGAPVWAQDVAEAVRRADAARKARGLWLRLWKAVRCPSDLDPWMRKAGGLWEPASRRWLIERRIAPHQLGARHRHGRDVEQVIGAVAGIGSAAQVDLDAGHVVPQVEISNKSGGVERTGVDHLARSEDA